jgi:hypothetical protein
MRSVVARNAQDAGKRRRQPRTFALLPSGPDVPSARFAVMLANALGRIGTQGADARIGVDRSRSPNGSRAARWSRRSSSIALTRP